MSVEPNRMIGVPSPLTMINNSLIDSPILFPIHTPSTSIDGIKLSSQALIVVSIGGVTVRHTRKSLVRIQR